MSPTEFQDIVKLSDNIKKMESNLESAKGWNASRNPQGKQKDHHWVQFSYGNGSATCYVPNEIIDPNELLETVIEKMKDRLEKMRARFAAISISNFQD